MLRFLIRSLTILPAIGAGLALAFPTTAVAQNFGDARRGGGLARDLCAECHAVVPGRRSPNQAAPTFEIIARTAGLVGLALEAALQSTHRQMPNVMLAAPERADIIAYIESLRDRK